MDTMRYHEKKKSAKIPIIIFALFVIIGGAILIFAMSIEEEPNIIGDQNIEAQSLKNTTQNQIEIYEGVDNSKIQYEVNNKYLSDKSYAKFKSNITLPIITVDGEDLTEINGEIIKKYSDMYNTLKQQMKEKVDSSVNKYTYTVTYKKYENTISEKRIVSITIYERIVDDTAKKNTMETINSYNIDLSSEKVLSQSDFLIDYLGSNYKDVIRKSVKDYVVNAKYITEDAYKYTLTGLENFYFKDGKLKLLFNAGDIVDKKYGILDITIVK